MRLRLFPHALASLLSYLLGHALQDQACRHPRLFAHQHPQFHRCALLLRQNPPQVEGMSRPGIQSGAHRQAQEVIALVSSAALGQLLQAPEPEEAQIGQIQASRGHLFLIERALAIGMPARGEQRPTQVSREHIPAHKELEHSLTAAGAAATAAPALGQFCRQADRTAIFHDDGREALEQGDRGRFRFQAHLREPLQQSLQKGGRFGRKALAPATRGDVHLTPLGDLRHTAQGHLWFLQPAEDECLGKVGSVDGAFPLYEARFLGQVVGFLFQDLSQGLGQLCYTDHSSSITNSGTLIFLHDGTWSFCCHPFLNLMPMGATQASPRHTAPHPPLRDGQALSKKTYP